MSKSLLELKAEFESALQGDFQPREISQLFSVFYEEIFDLTRIQVLSDSNIQVSAKKVNEFNECLLKLKNHEPYQYIFNKAEFRGLEFYVNDSVLIPRPETEELISTVLESIKDGDVIIDLGTGSGCIPVSIKKEFPNCEVWALDVCPEAISVAKRNALEHHVQVSFLEASMENQLDIEKEISIFISNPPYIGLDEKELLEENVSKFEPHLALFSKTSDPLYFYKQIEKRANESLKSGGYIFLELHENYAEETREIFSSSIYGSAILINDMQGKQRILKVVKN